MNNSQPENPEAVFQRRQQDFAALENQFKSKANRVSMLRIVVFLMGGVMAAGLFYEGETPFGFLALLGFYFVFALLIKWHNRLNYAQQHNNILSQINAEEILRLNGDLGKFDDGIRYRDNLHFYTSDLDIFGKQSLFALVNRAVTVSGKNLLAYWFLKAAAAEEILARQEAATEITDKLEWRQQLEAKARHFKRNLNQLPGFLNWLAAPGFFVNRVWLLGLVFLLPIITIAAIIAWNYEWLSGYYIGAMAFVQYLFNAKFAAEKENIRGISEDLHHEVSGYVSALEHLEQSEFKSPKLLLLHQQLFLNTILASASIKKLAGLLDYLAATQNVYLNMLLNSVLMWDFFWLWRLDKWKSQAAPLFEPAINTLAEFEALASFAAFHFANPRYCIPEISAVPFEISAAELSHPLIFSATRTANSFSTEGAGKTMIITGSNMSGKSTFLRTVGLNMVLAYAGAAVCARQFKAFPMQVFTAMRTEDNLAESTSSFYAELKRLKMLLDLTENSGPVFYFLDEILKGTNSKDRHLGAVALVRQLHKRQASGMVSTHDLELGALEKELPGSVNNFSFNSRIEGDEIIFDYHLQPGVCHSFNASKLMQKMGIAIGEV